MSVDTLTVAELIRANAYHGWEATKFLAPYALTFVAGGALVIFILARTASKMRWR